MMDIAVMVAMMLLAWQEVSEAEEQGFKPELYINLDKLLPEQGSNLNFQLQQIKFLATWPHSSLNSSLLHPTQNSRSESF